MADGGIKSKVDLKSFEKAAADRIPMGVIAKENGATITRLGMDGKSQTIEANAGDKLYKGDIIKTPDNGSITIILSAGGGSAVDISKFELSSSHESDEVKRGTLNMISGKIVRPLEGSTPMNFQSSSGGVRG